MKTLTARRAGQSAQCAWTSWVFFDLRRQLRRGRCEIRSDLHLHDVAPLCLTRWLPTDYIEKLAEQPIARLIEEKSPRLERRGLSPLMRRRR